MCHDHHDLNPRGHAEDRRKRGDGPFPWHLGAFDAHCHPTDTMASIAGIPELQPRALTIMATRSQDQHLVEQVAASQGVTNRMNVTGHDVSRRKIIPSFGWHPWFSHQLYDDTSDHVAHDRELGENAVAFKKAHYEAVLTPAPSGSDLIDSLPAPTLLSSFIQATRSRLLAHPLALVGEIGLDKSFRLPHSWDQHERDENKPEEQVSVTAASRDDGLTPGGREGRRLSPHRVAISHQRAVLDAQLALAGELGRAVSVHGVQAHGILYEAVSERWKGWEREVVSRRQKRLAAPNSENIDDSDDDETEAERGQQRQTSGTGETSGRPFPPRICLHSFSAGVGVLKQWLHPSVPADMYFSFSTAVNLSTDASQARALEVLKAIPADRVLVESDLHTAADGHLETALEDMYRLVCEVKDWDLEDGVKQIKDNFEAFIFGR